MSDKSEVEALPFIFGIPRETVPYLREAAEKGIAASDEALAAAAAFFLVVVVPASVEFPMTSGAGYVMDALADLLGEMKRRSPHEFPEVWQKALQASLDSIPAATRVVKGGRTDA